MARELTLFLSSAVEGLKPVRDEIAAILQGRGIVVRKSDDPGFPIATGVHSHDACLRAMEGVHVCVVLIGTRYGGEYAGRTGKSITWMEYEAAREVGAYPIVLIHEHMNDLAGDIWRERRKLEKKYPADSPAAIDARLRSKKAFADWKPIVDNLPAQQRFIDAVRKGHVDNWVHDDWTGTTRDAMRWIDARLATLLASTVTRFADVDDTAASLMRLNHMLPVLVKDLLDHSHMPEQAVKALLVAVESLRTELFGFGPDDKYNMALFRRDATDVYHTVARRSHASIVHRGRTWRLGKGQVGTAAAMDEPLITPDLSASSMRTTDPKLRPDDESNYRSVVSVPLLSENGKADLVFIVSTDRAGHFRAKDQAEVLTVEAVGHIFGTLWLVGGHVDGKKA